MCHGKREETLQKEDLYVHNHLRTCISRGYIHNRKNVWQQRMQCCKVKLGWSLLGVVRCLKCLKSRLTFTPLLQLEDYSRFPVTKQYKAFFYFFFSTNLKTFRTNFALLLLGTISTFVLTLSSSFLTFSGKAGHPNWFFSAFFFL